MASAIMDSEAVEREAADWFARRESDAWTSADEAQFDEWLAQRTAHRIAFIRLQSAWQRAGRLRALSAGMTEGVIPPRGSLLENPLNEVPGSERPQPDQRASEATRPARRPVARRWIALAASILLALVSGVYVFQSGLLDSNRYATRIGTM